MTLLRARAAMGLREAKQAVDGLLDGQEVRIEIDDEVAASAVKNEIEALGATCAIQNEQLETKFLSEEVWRKSLAMQRDRLAAVERNPFERNKIREMASVQARIDRIFRAGLPAWQERDRSEDDELHL